MTAVHFVFYSDARAHLKDLLDAADEGRPATVARDSRRVAVVQLDRLRSLLAAAVPAPVAVSENDGWSLIMPGLPIAADGSSLDEALDDLIVALREYAEDWNARLRLAPNHQCNWRLTPGPARRPQRRRRAHGLDRRSRGVPAPTEVRLGTRQDHQTFVTVEGWQQARNARGTRGSQHATSELVTVTGLILRTRISHPPDRTTYGPDLWSHVLRDQLQVTSDEFWDAVKANVTPDRGAPPQPRAALPVQIVYQLIHTVGVPEAEVARMSREQAISRLNDHWSGLP